jgi:hypothetical protein
MAQYKIHVLEHAETGLLMALCGELDGFVVHAHSDEEMEAKLVPAFKQFLKALGKPVGQIELTRTAPPGYRPPTFLAKAALEAEAA